MSVMQWLSGPVYFTGSIYIFKTRVSDQQLNIVPLRKWCFTSSCTCLLLLQFYSSVTHMHTRSFSRTSHLCTPKWTCTKSQVCVIKQFKPYSTANAFSNSTDCAMQQANFVLSDSENCPDKSVRKQQLTSSSCLTLHLENKYLTWFSSHYK